MPCTRRPPGPPRDDHGRGQIPLRALRVLPALAGLLLAGACRELRRQDRPHGDRRGDEVDLQYYRLSREFSGAIELREGDAQQINSPTDVGTGRAEDEQAPLSTIIQLLNERFGTQFTEEDRLFFQQIKERACRNTQVVQTALANPLDEFELGIRKLIEDLMIERMGENDKIVTRYMADRDFQSSAFPVLAREIFDAIHSRSSSTEALTKPVGNTGPRPRPNLSPHSAKG